VDRVLAFEQGLLRHFRDEYPEVVEQLDREKKLGDELEAKVRQVIEGFKGHFVREMQQAS
jgi:F0F1-type ATP synthase alpha subunit